LGKEIDGRVLAEAGGRAVSPEFWASGVSLLDADVADFARIHGPRQITDVHLLALAVRHHGQFVTLDPSVTHDAHFGAQKKHVVVL
jgi:predicted nucleic acid-binding protein